VRYPLDSYIDPDLIDLRRLEGNYDYVIQYMAKCFRRTNEVAIQMLSEAHKMEMATLLEYLTQQNVLAAQTIIERIDARTLKPLELLELE
jgi:BarA-like signal transduction histidine kinase